MQYHLQSSALTIAICLSCLPAHSQVIPDNTLGSEKSAINVIDELNDRIDGGAIRGSNLFHSFSEFNVGEGAGVHFASPDGIANILSRVTGGNPSNVLGKLGVLGNANLFFLNPNGIIFGPNASLDISGSFLATTARSINFADGTEFSATTPNNPVLTFNIPVGLGFTNPGKIEVNGLGHNLILNFFAPTISFPSSKLEAGAGQTLALIGGDIVLDGGVVSASDGLVELGSVIKGNISFDSSLKDFTYNASQFGDIQLVSRALADASGVNGGSIKAHANRLFLQSGSIFFNQNQSGQQAGSISIDTTSLTVNSGSVDRLLRFPGGAQQPEIFLEFNPKTNLLRGGFANGQPIPPEVKVDEILALLKIPREQLEEVFTFTPSSIFTEALSSGQGGNIKINTEQLLITNGGQVISRGFDAASAGSITANASNLLEISGASGTLGFAESGIEVFSSINSNSFGSGEGGAINLITGTLQTRGGGSIASTTSATGRSGDVYIQADSINLQDIVPGLLDPSSISSTTLAQGNAGNVTVEATEISLQKGAAISSSTLAQGNAGNLEIKSDFIEVRGDSSIIASGSLQANPTFRRAFSLPEIPTGQAGNIQISTDRIEVNQGASITVQSDGTGDAGNINLDTDSIFLNDAAGITAATASGLGGNITLHTDSLRLDNNSLITATAGGTGDGGNIIINANSIIGLNNSDITANAFEGRGGRIDINTQGLFGLQQNDQLSEFSEITAFSEIDPNLNGEVSIDVLSQNSNFETSQVNRTSTEQLIVSCFGGDRNDQRVRLTQTGRSALPPRPETQLPILEIPDPSTLPQSELKERQPGDPIVEATGFAEDANGELQMVAANSQKETSKTLTCY